MTTPRRKPTAANTAYVRAYRARKRAAREDQTPTVERIPATQPTRRPSRPAEGTPPISPFLARHRARMAERARQLGVVTTWE